MERVLLRCGRKCANEIMFMRIRQHKFPFLLTQTTRQQSLYKYAELLKLCESIQTKCNDNFNVVTTSLLLSSRRCDYRP